MVENSSAASDFLIDDRPLARRLDAFWDYCRAIPFDDTNQTWADVLFGPGAAQWPVTRARLVRAYQDPDGTKGALPTIQAFVLAALAMQETPRALLNSIPQRHRDLYYRTFLRLTEQPARPDWLVATFTLVASRRALDLKAGLALDGGRTAGGSPRIYTLDRDLTVNRARLTDLAWTRPLHDNGGTAIGIGADVAASRPWPAGGMRVPLRAADGIVNDAETPLLTGRIIASPELASAGGTRTVTVTFAKDVDGDETIIAAVTSGSTWLALQELGVGGTEDRKRRRTFSLDANAPAIDGVVAREGFSAALPLLRLSRGNGREVPAVARITLHVRDAKGILVWTDAGLANASRPGAVFGERPIVGSAVEIAVPELIGKTGLNQISLQPSWGSLPETTFSDWYKEYTTSVSNDSFKCRARIEPSSAGVSTEQQVEFQFFQTYSQPHGPAIIPDLLQISVVAQTAPVVTQPAEPWRLRLELTHDFLHAEYAALQARSAPSGGGVQGVPKRLNSPYTPRWNGLIVDYTCSAAPVEQRIITPFGSTPAQAQVSENPPIREPAALYAGFADVEPGEQLTLWWELSSTLSEGLHWQYFCADNHWRNLDRFLDDGTAGLTRAGFWTASIPADATTVGAAMPSGRIWVRAYAHEPVEEGSLWLQAIEVNAGVCHLRDAETIDASHFDAQLPAGSVVRPLETIDGLRIVAQPYASEGGRAAERPEAFAKRVAARLRHRNRAVTGWDMQELLMAEFPEIYAVVPLLSDISAGPPRPRLLIVPRVIASDSGDPARPQLRPGRLDEMRAFLTLRASPWLDLTLVQPRYTAVKLTATVVFVPGINIARACNWVEAALYRRFVPWADGGAAAAAHGVAINLYDVIAAIENLDYVDHAESVRLKREDQSDYEDQSVDADSDEVLVIDTFDISTPARPEQAVAKREAVQ